MKSANLTLRKKVNGAFPAENTLPSPLLLIVLEGLYDCVDGCDSLEGRLVDRSTAQKTRCLLLKGTEEPIRQAEFPDELCQILTATSFSPCSELRETHGLMYACHCHDDAVVLGLARFVQVCSVSVICEAPIL